MKHFRLIIFILTLLTLNLSNAQYCGLLFGGKINLTQVINPHWTANTPTGERDLGVLATYLDKGVRAVSITSLRRYYAKAYEVNGSFAAGKLVKDKREGNFAVIDALLVWANDYSDRPHRMRQRIAQLRSYLENKEPEPGPGVPKKHNPPFSQPTKIYRGNNLGVVLTGVLTKKKISKEEWAEVYENSAPGNGELSNRRLYKALSEILDKFDRYYSRQFFQKVYSLAEQQFDTDAPTFARVVHNLKSMEQWVWESKSDITEARIERFPMVDLFLHYINISRVVAPKKFELQDMLTEQDYGIYKDRKGNYFYVSGEQVIDYLTGLLQKTDAAEYQAFQRDLVIANTARHGGRDSEIRDANLRLIVKELDPFKSLEEAD